MALKQLFTNNAVSLLKTGIGPTATTIEVLAGQGAQFPNPGANEFFTVTLEDQSALVQEIVHVVHRAGDVFTIVRGQEGTEPRAWTASQGHDTLVDHRLTALTLNRLANTFDNTGYPSLNNFQDAIDYLLQISPIAGGQIVDAAVNIEIVGNETVIYTPSAYKPGSTLIFVGGNRQKRGVDFFEVGPTELRLPFILTAEHIAAGQNVVVDYVLA